jgi:hypothetical protein
MAASVSTNEGANSMDSPKPKAKPFSLTQSEPEVPAQIIPAQPGYELIEWSCGKDDEFRFRRLVIIAWQIGSIARPITIGGNHEDAENPMAVLTPSGRVEDHSGGCTYESFEAWEVAARAEWTRDHALVKHAMAASASSNEPYR